MASVAPVTTFSDTPEAWLEYLSALTRWTVGARCTAAEVVALGRYEALDDSLRVAEALAGDLDSASLSLELPRPAGAGAPSRYPVPQDGDRVLAFLTAGEHPGRWRPIDAPGAIALESGTDDLDASVAAARWFCAIGADPAARASELAGAVEDEPDVLRFTAIRAIGDESLEPAAAVLRGLATDASAEPRTATYAMVGLWLLGQRSVATDAFAALVSRLGQNDFMTLWQVQRSLGEESETLYGPAPDGWEASR